IEEPVSMLSRAPEAAECAEIKLEGRTLTVSPKAAGTKTFVLAAESNGRKITKTVNVKVNGANVSTGISDLDAESAKSVTGDGRDIVFSGYAGETFEFYSLSCVKVLTISVDESHYVARTGLPSGVYVLSGSDGTVAKIVIR
ncbi:MAG: hypothetical protein K2K72_05075, partial [Duncaniella sp.]|nr:hypothetical protein [Duncaniella sp.]